MDKNLPDTTANDKQPVRYIGPALDADHTLPELVGLPTWELVLVADWGDRTLTFDSRLASDNSIPGDEWHGHAQAYDVPILGKADALQLIEEATPLVARVCDGYQSEWDGSNHVAKLTQDAEAALEDLDHAIQNYQPTHVDGAGDLWDAGDWFDAAPPTVDATATDEDLAALEKELQTDAHAAGVHLHGIDVYLEGVRDEAQEQAVTRIDWDTTSDPSNPGWVARQGRLDWPVQGCESDATDAELVDAADAWAPAGVYVATAEVDRTEVPERVTADNFRAILDGLGYYNGETFGNAEQVREYLSASNLLDVFGEVAFTGAELARLAELAIEHREHWAEPVDRWTAALQVARECGAEAARQSTRPIPEWTGEPILHGDWDAIEAALGSDPSNIDSPANQELIDAWLAGYEQASNAEGVDHA